MKKIDSKHFIYAVTSKDIRSDLIDDGIKKGAETFLQKPIMPDAIRDMWPIFELRKVNQTNNTMIGSSLAKVPTDMGQSSRPRKSDDKVKRSSSRMDVMSTSNYASSAGINIEAHGISSGIPTSQRAGQLKIRDIIESSTAYNNPYEANQMNYYGQTTVVPQWNNNSTNRGLVGSDDINGRLINSEPAPYIGCSFAENQVVHTLGMDDEIGNMQPVGLDIGTSLASNQVENTFTMNEEQQNGDGSGYELHNFTIFSPSPSKAKDDNAKVEDIW
ncbi:hypothetical protein ACET3Z_002536 [Daucus carota]